MSHPEWGPNHLAHHQLVLRETRWSTERHWQRTEMRDPSAYIHRRSPRDTQTQTTPGPGERSPAHRGAHMGLRHTGQASHTAHSPRLPNTHTHTNTAPLRGKMRLQNRVGVLGPERPKYGCSPHLPHGTLSSRSQVKPAPDLGTTPSLRSELHASLLPPTTEWDRRLLSQAIMVSPRGP